MESLPTLDALLAHDGKDVGTALPTEVWASTSQGTLRCWSEGAKLRLEKATDATAAPADAVLIAFKSAEAEREVVAADGAKALVAAVAAGKISVRGDVVALRPVAERIVAALQRGAPIAVDAPEKRTDGVVVYAVESCVEINQRVRLLETSRHRADVVTGTTSRRWCRSPRHHADAARGAPEI